MEKLWNFFSGDLYEPCIIKVLCFFSNEYGSLSPDEGSESLLTKTNRKAYNEPTQP